MRCAHDCHVFYHNCMLILFWAPCDYLYTILNLESSQQLKDLRIYGNEIVPRLWYTFVEYTFLSENSSCCYLAVSPFFWRGCADQYLSLYLGPAHLHFGALRSILTWVSVLLLDVFETCCYAWLPLTTTSMSLNFIYLFKFMICVSFEDIQKHDSNTIMMSYILPFLLVFPAFKEKVEPWTIPAPWLGTGGCETARISARHRSRNCEEMALLGAWVE